MPDFGGVPTQGRQKGLRRPFVLWGILLGVAVLSAFLMSPQLSGRQLPQLGEEDLGRPFRASSVIGFKASRNFEVIDVARTQMLKEEARSSIRPVFDFDSSIESRVKEGVRTAFGMMRSVIQVHEAQHPNKMDLKERDLLLKLRSARPHFETQIVPPENEDFEVLARARFSSQLEQAAIDLLELAYRARVVASRDELSRIDAAGITVRLVGKNTEFDLVTAHPVVMDLREVASELDRHASVPGNLLPDAPVSLRRSVLRLARRQVRVNLTVNIAETQSRKKQASEAIKPVSITIKKGQRLIGDGELINKTHLLMLRSLRAQMSELELMQLQLGSVGVVAMLLSIGWLFFRAAFRRFRPLHRDVAFMGLFALLLQGGLRLWVLVADAVHDRYQSIPVEALLFAFPVAAGSMLVRFVLSEECALFFTFIFSVLAGIMLGNSLPFCLFALLTSLMAADRIARTKDRAGIFHAGLSAGLVAFGMIVCLGLADGKGLGAETLLGGAFAFVSTAFAVPMLVLALTPLVEMLFGYASDVKLLELANLNHPALKDLVLNAPGTYHHSIVMGSLVESAAEAIDSNPLLARSCAYYHDIGKGKNPAYFGENQKGDNVHDTLPPAVSATIIKRHVTDGLEMARRYKLPQRVAAAIPEHHGTRLVGFFVHKARKALETKGEGFDAIDEAFFRYPGPRPQSRETALLMIADACEAASRSLVEPTTEQLHALVQKMINIIFNEGQLDECDLTLKDLQLIASSFTRTLEGICHARPSYPPEAIEDDKPPLVV